MNKLSERNRADMGIGKRLNNNFTIPAQQDDGTKEQLASSKEKKETTPSFIPQPPKYSLDDVILPQSTLSAIKNALAIKEKSDLVFNQWGLHKTHKYSKKVGINLYGPPGTGKTMVAHAIADYLDKQLLVINYADIESKYVGETPKNLTEAFRVAKETDSILFFDEADAILSRRVTNMNNATDTSVNQTRSVMLTLLNEYQGVIIFATNYISNYDPAFMRRILAHIQFELPDYDARVRLFQKLIPAEMPTDVRIEELARRFDGISGSDISNAVLLAAFRGSNLDRPFVYHEFFVEALEGIQKSQQANRGHENIRIETREVSEEYVRNMLHTGGECS
jgi:SpoVK/Ycf46/Vps4 family AAA+-type ATPase